MDIRPILSTLLRHKTAAALIVIEVALSCAIICNAVFLIMGRVENIRSSTGIDEHKLVHIQLTGLGRNQNAMALTRQDLATLRAVPGVEAVSISNQIPLGRGSWNTGVMNTSDQKLPTFNSTLYLGSPDLVDTLGLKLIAGHKLDPDTYTHFDPDVGLSSIRASTALISKDFADRMFPGESAVGRRFYVGPDQPVTVVGVMERLVRPIYRSTATEEYSMLLPIEVPYTGGGNYLLRTAPERRAEVLQAALKTLKQNSSSRVVLEKHNYDDVRAEYYRQDKAMVWLLAIICTALLTVTAFGIVGLANFWVQQRTKQIGIRRALGATHGQILRYFQTENFLLASIGIALGMLLAYVINLWLMSRYELPRLPLAYLPLGAAILWLLGQLAVLGPARRAARVPPAVATRSA